MAPGRDNHRGRDVQRAILPHGQQRRVTTETGVGVHQRPQPPGYAAHVAVLQGERCPSWTATSLHGDYNPDDR